MEKLTYTLNFNFGNGFDNVPDTITRDFRAKTITVKDGANGQIKTFNSDNANDMRVFFGALALTGTHEVYPAQFAPCPYHENNGAETIAFALPIDVYKQLSKNAVRSFGVKNRADFNADNIPDTAYINPEVPNLGYVHIEPTR